MSGFGELSRNGMDFGWSQTPPFGLLATSDRPEKGQENNRESHAKCTFLSAGSKGRCCFSGRLSFAHVKLSSLFRWGSQQVEGTVKDWVFRREGTRSQPRFLL